MVLTTHILGWGGSIDGAHYQYTGVGALMVLTTSTLGWEH